MKILEIESGNYVNLEKYRAVMRVGIDGRPHIAGIPENSPAIGWVPDRTEYELFTLDPYLFDATCDAVVLQIIEFMVSGASFRTLAACEEAARTIYPEGYKGAEWLAAELGK